MTCRVICPSDTVMNYVTLPHKNKLSGVIVNISEDWQRDESWLTQIKRSR